MMNHPGLGTLLLAVILIGQTAFLHASESVVLTDDLQMTLGNSFLAEGDYYRAITEYKKLTFLFPDSDRVPEALYQIGIAYYRGEDYASAAKSFAKVRQTYAATYFSSAAFHEGLCFDKLGQDEAAIEAFERARWFDTAHPDASNAQIGIALSAAKRDDPVTSRQALTDFLDRYPGDNREPGVHTSFTLLDMYEAQPKKSPALAGTLSAIIPGSGQVYAEHYRDGIVAFVVNGLFIAGTVTAINHENYALAGIVGGVGLPFYVGNIYGAANASRKWNLSLSRQLRDALALTLSYHY
ncbi:MAG: tetratricopeptide repeat protein [Deltaproteobacteria bacterium]|jgi:tetratricopeptide (TPR) repeat protein|nr:tetratricopeptide repeat protein [Deltaproteobacteria bacterium]